MPTDDLPEEARRFAQLPMARNTELSRLYHLSVYERWCAKHDIEPWPAKLPTLLEFAAERATRYSFSTVYGHIRIVAAEERARSGVELLMHLDMQKVLKGVLRERPPRPTRPIEPEKIARLFAYEPTTKAQRQVRGRLLVTYAAGMSLVEHLALRVEMIRFVDGGLVIQGLSLERPQIFVGYAQEARTCPVQAIRFEIGERTSGPLWISPRSRRADHGLAYGGLVEAVRLYSKACGVPGLSNARVLRAGVLEQSRRVSTFRLAHFLGRRNVTDFERKLHSRVVTAW